MNYVYYYADAGNEVLEDRFPDLNLSLIHI